MSDLLRVILIKEPNDPEPILASLSEVKADDRYLGTLLVEPKQDFGLKAGDEIEFFKFTDDKGNSLLICDMNPSRTITAKDLEDGKMLKWAISVFNENPTMEKCLKILALLRDSYVWIPCSSVMSDNDQKRMAKMINEANGDLDKLKGMNFVTKDEMRLIPDIFQRGEELFFPVFSSIEEMDECEGKFSKVEKHFLEALSLAKNNKNNLSGIVINAFSEPFVLDKELWHIIEELESGLTE